MIALKPADASSHFIEANGVRLHYLDYGTAGKRPMLCVHGGAAHAHWFDYVAPGLCTDHHVYSMDLRGHGDSGWSDPATYSWQQHAADLAAFVEKLDLRDFILVGHSMGGMISLIYAATYPGRMARLVIVDTIMLMPQERVEKMRAFSAMAPKSYDTQEELVARYRLEPAKARMAAPEIVRRMALHSGRQDAQGRWSHKADRRVYANFEQIDGARLWEKVKVPALVIRGEHSTRYTPEGVAEVRVGAPQVEVAEVPASDHHITLDNPSGFVEAVRKFLQTPA